MALEDVGPRVDFTSWYDLLSIMEYCMSLILAATARWLYALLRIGFCYPPLQYA